MAGFSGKRTGASHRPAPREAKPVSRSYLINAAQSYLQRYATSRANLERVLVRKARLRGQEAFFTPQTRDLIIEVLDALERMELLDDKAFAAGSAGTLKRKGTSSALARQKLGLKGVNRELAASAIASLDMQDGEQAMITARRLKLGPWRRLDPGAAFTLAEMGKLQRRGFNSAAIREAIRLWQEGEQESDQEA